jgi:MFS family permease
MGIGCFITIIATFIQCFSPHHKIGVFIFGRVLIGIGQGIALSKNGLGLTRGTMTDIV